MRKIILIPLALALFASCGEEKVSDKMVFRYNSTKNITTLDPAYAKYQADFWAVNQLYNGLVQMNKDLEVTPGVAHTWDISEDRLVYTFHLRRDVYFHPHEQFPQGKGRPVTAHDFVYSYTRLIDPALATKGAWALNDKIAQADPFVAVNDSTLEIRLAKPFEPFLGTLTMQYFGVVPQEVVEHYGKDFRVNPVGTGPFKLKQWKESQYLLLSKNPKYFEVAEGKQLPLLDEVIVSFIQEKNMEFIKLLQGEIDMVSGIDGKTVKDDILTKKGELVPEVTDRIVLDRAPYLITEYIGILVDPNKEGALTALQEKKIRQAINYAIDRDNMIIFLRNNIGHAANGGFIPRGLPAHQADIGYTYNKEKAQELVATSGVDVSKLEPIQLLTTAANLDLCTFIQKQLEEIGIPVSIDIVDSGAMVGMTSKSQVPFFRASWIADYPSEESMLVVFNGNKPAPPNYTRFQNNEFDSLYAAALEEGSAQARKQIYQRMDAIVVEEAPVVFLFHDEVLHFKRKHVKGLYVNGLNSLNLKTVYIE